MIIKQKPALLNKVARLCIFQYETYITNMIHKRVTNSESLKQQNIKYHLFPKSSLFGVW